MSSRGSTTGESTSGRTDGQCDREIEDVTKSGDEDMDTTAGGKATVHQDFVFKPQDVADKDYFDHGHGTLGHQRVRSSTENLSISASKDVSPRGSDDGHSPRVYESKRGSNANDFAEYDSGQRVSRQTSRNIPAAGMWSHGNDDEARRRSNSIERSRSGSRESDSEQSAAAHPRGTDGRHIPRNAEETAERRRSDAHDYVAYNLSQRDSSKNANELSSAGRSSHGNDDDEARRRSNFRSGSRESLNSEESAALNAHPRGLDGRHIPRNAEETTERRRSDAHDYVAYNLSQRDSSKNAKEMPAAGMWSDGERGYSGTDVTTRESVQRGFGSRSGSTESLNEDQKSSAVARPRGTDGRHTPRNAEETTERKRSDAHDYVAYNLDQRDSNKNAADRPAAGMPTSGNNSPRGEGSRSRSNSIGREASRSTTDAKETMDNKNDKNKYGGTWLQEDHKKEQRSTQDNCHCNHQGPTTGQFVHFNHCRYYADPADARNLHDDFESGSQQKAGNSDGQGRRASPPPTSYNNIFTDGKVLVGNETMQDYDRRHIASANHPMTSFNNMKNQ